MFGHAGGLSLLLVSESRLIGCRLFLVSFTRVFEHRGPSIEHAKPRRRDNAQVRRHQILNLIDILDWCLSSGLQQLRDHLNISEIHHYLVAARDYLASHNSITIRFLAPPLQRGLRMLLRRHDQAAALVRYCNLRRRARAIFVRGRLGWTATDSCLSKTRIRWSILQYLPR